ncbi:hypothetical protein FKM82_014115 [Ascaphus truei]
MFLGFTYAIIILQCVAAQITASLYPPRNVTTVSRNFRLYLTWTPASENPEVVYYNVSYKLFYKREWKHVSCFKNKTRTECNLTCALSDYTMNHTVRVRAVSPSSESSWVEIGPVSYLFTVEPAPPKLEVTRGDQVLYIRATVKTPSCIKLIYDLKYDVMFWEAEKLQEKRQINDILVNSAVTIKTPGLHGNYCVAARTKYTVDTVKESAHSRPVCLLIVYKDEDHVWGLVVGIPFSLLLFFCGFYVIYYHLMCRRAYETKTPEVLDFCQYRIPRAISVLESTDKFLEKYHTITIEQTWDPSASVISLLTTADGKTSSGFGYTEKHLMQGETVDGLSENGSTIGSRHLSSILVGFNGDACSLSDLSCEDTSGPVIRRCLSLNEIQKEDFTLVLILTNKTDAETGSAGSEVLQPVQPSDLWHRPPTDLSLGQPPNGLCVLPPNERENVCFETLKITHISGQVANSDTDGSTEQLSEDFTDDEMSDHSDIDLKDVKPQQNRCTGYQQRGYMAREC